MASTSADISSTGFSVGRVFARGAGAMFANLPIILPIAFLCGALPNNGIARLMARLTFTLLMAFPYPYPVLSLWPISIALGAFLGVVTQAAATRAVVTYADGGRPTLGAALLSGLIVFFPLLLLAILMSLATAIGVVLLIAPGLFLLVACSVAASALIEDRSGVIDALYRSFYLTKGARWRILGIELILFGLGLAATALITPIATALFRMSGTVTNGMVLLRLVPTLTIHTVLYAFVPAVKAALYVELRNWKDGPQTDTLAEVFA